MKKEKSGNVLSIVISTPQINTSKEKIEHCIWWESDRNIKIMGNLLEN
jgi:hypothetical protein